MVFGLKAAQLHSPSLFVILCFWDGHSSFPGLALVCRSHRLRSEQESSIQVPLEVEEEAHSTLAEEEAEDAAAIQMRSVRVMAVIAAELPHGGHGSCFNFRPFWPVKDTCCGG